MFGVMTLTPQFSVTEMWAKALNDLFNVLQGGDDLQYISESNTRDVEVTSFGYY